MGQATASGAAVTTVPPPVVPVALGSDWKKIGLWAVLLLGVAALAGMAFSLLRKPRYRCLPGSLWAPACWRRGP
ncbi:DUF3999 family protein [Pseudomonas sp. PCH446]